MIELKATPRETDRKSTLKALRKEGKIPAVIYGKKVGSIPIYVEEKAFFQFERDHGLHTLLKLNWGEGSSAAMIGEVQRDTLRNDVLHIDFKEADLSTEMKVEIPIEWVGEEEAEKKSLILQRPLYAIEVSALPTNLPEKIEVDISTIEVGDTITVGDLQFGEGVEPQLPADTVVASALAPAASAAEGEEAEAAENEEAEASEEQESE